LLACSINDEIICVDDGSNVPVSVFWDEIAKVGRNIRLVSLPTQRGLSLARNAGLSVAQGEYVTFVDSDDWIDKSIFEEVLGFQNADILIYDIVREFPKESVLVVNDVPFGHYFGDRLKQLHSVMLFDYTKQRPAIHPSLCTKLIRREIIEKVIQNVADNIAYGEDALCSYACMLDAKSIAVTGKTGYHYRNNQDSVCNAYSAVMIDRFILLGNELSRLFSERKADMELQLYGYMARHCLECIRSELLLHSDASYITKRKNIKRLISHSLIKQSLNTAVCRISDPNTKVKMWLASNQIIFALYVLYVGRDIIRHVLQKR
jgi:glycosyltransferase involved in cell wall biosynthesis